MSKLTANGKLGTARYKLKEVASFGHSQLTHDLQKVADALAIHIVSMVCLDRVTQRYILISKVMKACGDQDSLSILQSSSTRPNSMTSSFGVNALRAE